MPIFHEQITAKSRADGYFAVKAAAYRSGSMIYDQSTQENHDYRYKSPHVVSRDLVLPKGAPFTSRAQLWNAAANAENRRNSIEYREFEVALPHELDEGQRKALVLEYAGWLRDRYKIACDVCVHRPTGRTDRRNHHAHIQTTTRRVTAAGLGEKVRELDCAKKTGEGEIIRAAWAEHVNRYLAWGGIDARVDHRSLYRQGITDRDPTMHLGPAATAIQRRGDQSARGAMNREIIATNAAVAAILAEEPALVAAPFENVPSV